MRSRDARRAVHAHKHAGNVNKGDMADAAAMAASWDPS